MIGVIGGSGFYTFFDSAARSVNLDTPFGEPSAPVTVGAVGEHEVAFLPRHGADHRYPAHKVPYRANMWALRALDRKSTRLNSSHNQRSRMPSSA